MRIVFFSPLALAAVISVYFGLTTTWIVPKHKSYDTSAGKVMVEQVAGSFSHPWALTFLSDGGMLVTERVGRLWRVDEHGARSEVADAPSVKSEGQGGLLDVVAARNFAESREIFMTFSEPEGSMSRTAVVIARLSDDGQRLENTRIIFRQQPAVEAVHHYGSRVVEALDGAIWVTLGERGYAAEAQNLSNHIGKVVRIARDGSVPPGNPFNGTTGLPEIWSLGHRNPQGAALDPVTGKLWTVEHGAKGGDEINQPEAGKNYGWPVITFGRNYNGAKIGEGTAKPGMEQPVHYWDPSIAPSGMMIYSGKLWPDWQGDIFVGALKYKLISRLDRQGDAITGEEQLFAEKYGRIRDIREAPDGAIWFLTDEGDGALYRVSPSN